MNTTSRRKTIDGGPYSTSRLFFAINLIISLSVALFLVICMFSHILDNVEFSTLDLRYKLRGKIEIDPNIVLIDIDEDSLKPLPHGAGAWPWSREWHGGLISTLKEYKAKLTAFDVFFTDPTPLVDFLLIESTRIAGNVFLGLVFEQDEVPDVSEEQIASSEPILSKYTISPDQISGNTNNLPKYKYLIPPLPELYLAAKGTGHLNTLPEKDGIVRKIPSLIQYKGNYYMHFSLHLAFDYLNINTNTVNFVLGKYIDLGETKKGRIKIPIDENGFLYVNWAAPWGEAFKHYSFVKIVVSYWNILKNKAPPVELDIFKNKICLIGLTATGLTDVKPIPLETTYPMVGLQANVVNSILTNNFVKDVSAWVNIVIIIFLTILVGFMTPKIKPIGGIFCILGILIIYSGISFFLFKFFGLIINFVYPTIALLLNFTFVTIHSGIVSAMEQSRLYSLAIEDGLTRLYVVRHFKEIMQREMKKAKQQNSHLSVIISDIDHFKKVNDTFGHLAGDFILKGSANIFKSSCKEGYTAGRYGGEEFIILLPETDREDAVIFANRLRTLIENFLFEYNDNKFNVTISFGVAQLKDEYTPDELIKRADEALYVAKETGRNKVCFN